jgi:hypothetical protein
MKGFYCLASALLLFSLAAGPIKATPITFQGKKCYLGVLHAHTVLSPDFQPKPSNVAAFKQLVSSNSEARFAIANGPFAAYKRAAELGKLDFLAVTDHVHGPESGQAEFCSHEMPSGGYELIRDSAQKINTDNAFKDKFLAIPGMEWSVISGGNHANIFFANNPMPQEIPNGEFRSLFTDYLNSVPLEKNNPLLLVQLNHPNQVSSATAYGRDAFTGSDASNEFVEFFKETYLGLEHINGSSNGGNNNTAELNAHRDGDSLETHYRTYLNMGFRLAPIGDHDNHRANWGRHTAARTGVWADGLTPQQFVEAYRARRVFASEDNEMAVAFLTDDEWMGSVVDVPDGGELRTFKVFIGQTPDTDTGQLENEGPYLVELIGDDAVGGPKARARNIRFNGQSVGSIFVPAGTTIEFTYRVKPGTYCYIHVTEMGGKDSGGVNADAWTAPIFFASL